MRKTKRVKSLCIEALEPRALLAGVPAGGEFRLSTFTTVDQYAPVVAADRVGNFVAVWVSDGQDGSGPGVYAQRYSAAGAAQGSELQINTYTTGVQALPAVAMDPAGDFVIAWTSMPADNSTQPPQDGSGAGVFARRYNAAGVAQDAVEFQVNTTTAGNQESPSVAMDGSGNFVIAWDSNGQDGSGYGVYARRYSSAGTALSGEIQINQFTQDLQADPSIAMDPAGDFVVAWTSGNQATGQDGSGYGIYARRYSPAGAALGDEFKVNTYTNDYQTFPSVAMDSTGDFVIAWSSYLQDGSGYGIYAQRYSAAGVAQGVEFRANTVTGDTQSQPAVAMDSRGDFTIVWSSVDQDGSGRGVYAQSYDLNGNATGTETPANTTTLNSQSRPSIAMDSAGDYIVAWQDGSTTVGVDGQDGSGYGVYAQRYDAAPIVTAATFNYITGPSLTFAFSKDVSASLTTSDIVLQNLTTSTTVPSGFMSLNYNSATNTATVTFPGYASGVLPDGNYRATLTAAGVTSAAGTALDGDQNGTPGGDYVLTFFVLAGDANHDRVVDISDLGILATNWQTSPRNFSQGDFNYDGLVDISDLGILATNWQKSIPSPAFPLNAAASSSTTLLAPATTLVRRPARPSLASGLTV